MSFPSYPAYKPSDVEWLGEVPEHWEVLPLKREFDVVGGSTPKPDMQEYWDGDIQWITPADLSRLQSFKITASIRTITAEGLNSCGTTMVPSGSVVVSTRAPIGSLGIAGIELCTNQGCKALVPIDQISSRFTAYFLGIATEALNVRGRGATFLEISGDELGAFKVSLPPCQEQVQIAAFLDRETAKIDALIAEQQRLIELLKEKRQAVISHAVTKGLNPDAPMKDSGVEWLGEVPEHWDCKPVLGVARERDEDNKGMKEDNLLSLSYGNIVNKDINTSDGLLPESFENYQIVRPGDIVLRLTDLQNDKRSLRSALVNQTGIITSAYLALKPESIDPKYLGYLLRAYDVSKVFYSMGGGLRQSMKYGDIKRMPLVIPTKTEQNQITTFLDRETTKIDTLIAEQKRLIELLHERRSALISAAVTGQIDVRGMVTEAGQQ